MGRQQNIVRAFFSDKPGGLSAKKTFVKNQPKHAIQDVDDFYHRDTTALQHYPRQYDKAKYHHKVHLSFPFSFLHMDVGEFPRKNNPSVCWATSGRVLGHPSVI